LLLARLPTPFANATSELRVLAAENCPKRCAGLGNYSCTEESRLAGRPSLGALPAEAASNCEAHQIDVEDIARTTQNPQADHE